MENVHPVMVHFPIALLSAAFLIETLALSLGKPAWHRIALWNLCLGTAAAAVAVLTGRLAEAGAKHSFEIHEVMDLHERLGYVVLSLAVGVSALRLFTRDRLGFLGRRLGWAALGLGVAVVIFSAHLGGRLVYEFGVGGVYGRSAGIEVTKNGSW